MKMSFATTVAVVTFVLLCGGMAGAQEAEDPPAPKPRISTGTGLLRGGAAVVVIGYAPALVVAAVAGALAEGGSKEALPAVACVVPVAGPLIATGVGDADEVGWGLAGASTGLQALGWALLIAGAVMKRGNVASVIEPTANGFVVRF